MGEKSWDESIADVEASLNAFREMLQSLPPGSKPTLTEGRELNTLARRIKLMTYAHQRAEDPEHRIWVDSVRSEMAGGERIQGGFRYTSDELRKRARVS